MAYVGVCLDNDSNSRVARKGVAFSPPFYAAIRFAVGICRSGTDFCTAWKDIRTQFVTGFAVVDVFQVGHSHVTSRPSHGQSCIFEQEPCMHLHSKQTEDLFSLDCFSRPLYIHPSGIGVLSQAHECRGISPHASMH